MKIRTLARLIVLILVAQMAVSSWVAKPALADSDQASLSSQSEYPTVSPNQQVYIYMTVLNSGTSVWYANGGDDYGWRGTDEWGNNSGTLNSDVYPNDTTTFGGTIQAPAQPGVYRYGFLLTHYGVDFGPYFFIQVTVKDNSGPKYNGPPKPNCWCVTYVVNYIFGGGLNCTFTCNTAASLATPNYWQSADAIAKDRARYQVSSPQKGDVFILQPTAHIWAYRGQGSNPLWFEFNSSQNPYEIGRDDQGNYDGHIGFVTSAVTTQDDEGWLINIRSAHWTWGNNTNAEAGCSNITDAIIYVSYDDMRATDSNGTSLVSFWR